MKRVMEFLATDLAATFAVGFTCGVGFIVVCIDVVKL